MSRFLILALGSILALGYCQSLQAVPIPLTERSGEETTQTGTGLNGDFWTIDSGNSLATLRGSTFTNIPTATFLATQIDYPRGPANDAGGGGIVNGVLSPDVPTPSQPGSYVNTSFRFSGYINILPSHDNDLITPGIQVDFGIPSDDATDVLLGSSGVPILVNDGGHGFPGGGAGPVTVDFEGPGQYAIDIAWASGGGGNGIELFSSIPGTPDGDFAAGPTLDIVPTSVLFAQLVSPPPLTPEPSTFALFGLVGAAGLGHLCWRRKR